MGNASTVGVQQECCTQVNSCKQEINKGVTSVCCTQTTTRSRCSLEVQSPWPVFAETHLTNLFPAFRDSPAQATATRAAVNVKNILRMMMLLLLLFGHGRHPRGTRSGAGRGRQSGFVFPIPNTRSCPAMSVPKCCALHAYVVLHLFAELRCCVWLVWWSSDFVLQVRKTQQHKTRRGGVQWKYVLPFRGTPSLS